MDVEDELLLYVRVLAVEVPEVRVGVAEAEVRVAVAEAEVRVAVAAGVRVDVLTDGVRVVVLAVEVRVIATLAEPNVRVGAVAVVLDWRVEVPAAIGWREETRVLWKSRALE